MPRFLRCRGASALCLALAFVPGLRPIPAWAAEPAAVALSPRQAEVRTAALYAQLIRGEAPRVAELSLLLTQMPKGGDLHHHYTGALYAETYLDWVRARDFCVYKADAPALQVQRLRIETRAFDSLPPEAQALCLKQPQIVADATLYRDLLSTWSDKDYDNHVHAQPAPDQQFFNTFGYFGPVSDHDVRGGLQSLKERAQAEHVQYLETMLRGAPTPALDDWAPRLDALGRAGDPAETTALLAQVFDWLEGQPSAQAMIADYVGLLDAAGRGLDDETFTLRFQTYISRNNAPSRSFAGLYAAFKAAQQSPWLVGVNIVGPENGEVAMRDYRLHMRMIGFLKTRFPATRLSLHAGELAPGMVPPEGLRFHIREAVQIAQASRIGHGIDIAQEDDADELLRQMARERRAVEINLSSNAFILGVKDEAHPLLLYRRFGVPLVISTDDAGVSRSSLSQEYLLYVTRYRPGYAELKQTVFNSLRYAFLDEPTRARELKRLQAAFERFEQRVARWPADKR